jgi:hypothetical protein
LSERGGRADAGGRNTDDGRADVRVIERQERRGDEHFTEGEPDLEPPEELAVLELDEETELEEDLDSRADLEDEVDDEVLESSLEHLVHDGDDEDGDGGDEEDGAVPTLALVAGDLEIEELEDREESLDRILREMLAGDEEAEDDLQELDIDSVASAAEVRVSACGADEFVCCSCFLVRSKTQRSGPSGSLCLDCNE